MNLRGYFKYSFLLVVILFVSLGCITCSYPETQQDRDFNSQVSSLIEIVGTIFGISTPQISSILNLAKTGLGVVETLYTIFSKAFNGTTTEFNILERKGYDKQLLAMFEMVDLRLQLIQRGVEGTQLSLRTLVKGLPHLVRWEVAMDSLEGYTLPINNLYHRFTYYQKHKSEIEIHTLTEFAHVVVSHATNSIQSYMANIHSIVSPGDPPVIGGRVPNRRTMKEIHERVTGDMTDKMEVLLNKSRANFMLPDDIRKRKEELSLRPSIFYMLEDAILNYEQCRYQQSPQQLIFGLYTLLALTQARGFMMIKFSYELLRYQNIGNFTIEQKLAEELYIHYSMGLMEVGKTVISRADNSYRKCDPSTHEEGKTFVMITELLQGYIENEVDLNTRGSCTSSCSRYEHSKVEGCFLPEQQLCGKQRRCNGAVHFCRYLDGKSTVCLSSLPYRRYDWVLLKNKNVLGNQEGTCRNEMTVNSWWRFFTHCSYCVCFCDDASSPTSDRFISLRAAISDSEDNKVVTGVRFIKKHRVLHIQIQQGKAMAQGQVDAGSHQWVEVEPIAVGNSQYIEGEDYVTLTFEARNFDLDYLEAPKGYVVTGLKFKLLGQHVNLEMFVTPVDFKTGILISYNSFWVSNDNTPEMEHNPRLELHLSESNDPRRLTSESVVDSTSNMFITLQATSLNDDLAQLTVPFFDAQPVAPEPTLWLEGVNLYHRGMKGFGGFVAFQVFNYNFSRYLDVSDDEIA